MYSSWTRSARHTADWKFARVRSTSTRSLQKARQEQQIYDRKTRRGEASQRAVTAKTTICVLRDRVVSIKNKLALLSGELDFATIKLSLKSKGSFFLRKGTTVKLQDVLNYSAVLATIKKFGNLNWPWSLGCVRHVESYITNGVS